jgi:general secretion pathway protein D
MVQQAKALGVQYGATDDSPAKVEALVRDFSDLTSRRDTQGNTDGYRSRYARLLIEQAEGFLPYRDYDKADELATLAAQQGVTFGPYQPNPNDLLKRIAEARRQDRLSASMTSGAGSRQVVPATGSPHYDRTATPALYDQAHDRTRNVLVNTQEPTPAPATGAMPPQPAGPAGAASVGESLFQQGETALMAHDTAKALDYFRQAANHSDQLDPITAQRLQGRLQMLSPPGTTPALPSPLIDQATAAQRNLYQQVAVEVAHQEGQAKAMRENDPKRALALLEETRKNVEAAGLEPPVRDRLLARLDRSLADMQQYIEQNRARIDLEERNQRTREEIDRQQKMTLDVQEKIALLVDEYNQLMHEQRFGEAEVVAKRITELDPQNAFAAQLVEVARLTRRHFSNLALQDEKESAFWETMNNVDKAGTPFDDNKPYVFGDIHTWRELTDRRLAARTERGRRRTERELEIERKLQTPVLLQFENAPLSQVVEYLARVAAVNIHLDAQGLADEGVTSNDPVTINIGEEISLRSALNLILDPLHLGYVIKDEVLKITSEQYREGDLYQVVYNVADLVVPIPNFVPSTGMGLAGAYHDAMGSIGFGGHGPFGGVGSPLAVVASRSGAPNSALVSPTVLAQMPSAQPGPTSAGTMPTGFGPGGLGGGAMADFDSLIELITTTVAPESWDDVGGPGSIAPFPTNLSLVVSQTQEVHDQLADLLEQLRKMQDLQVTIEVRFITLNDNFFERIGIDFDFDINDNVDRPFQVFGRADPTQSTTYATGLFNVGTGPPRDVEDTDHNNPDTVTVGLQQPGVFSADLDIPFTQNSFGLAIPQFGGFDATAGAQMGFAILSDLEAYFFINAAQGDRRSNVMQAPKVTLFNGQQAFVSDTSQSPFVISVIPVVGDFAAAQQPVIVVLSEGTFLTVQAVVSDDRRFVRLTVVPFFSRIGDVNTFTFEGSETTTENSSQQGNQDEPNDNTSKSNRSTVARSGTTVQLPTFSYVTVTTTVSVPDGGTVLLGGIKRLSEGRNEFGVPMLNKLPYVNRLFKNVGIGRETQSLMMTVTPRIIIQEEEEEALGIVTPP